MKELTLIIKDEFLNKYKKGYPLIMADSLVNGNILKEEKHTMFTVEIQKQNPK